ncbi:hypothetical protein [Pseudorhodoferax sp. Leaf267]|uniref:hypothetical protein n=1 Tax=Pseudorhodoferax sp. Leaf267 TaxID=1736316 RepID=UPI0012E2BD8A|nr:hypothetical protein [Pseudorhodoferax sp. Leaf267]
MMPIDSPMVAAFKEEVERQRRVQSPCNVIRLSTAAAQPPVQPARRGRFPKGVVPIWKGRALRNDREVRRKQIERRHGLIEGCLMSAAAYRAEIAELEARQ